jgi:hypothetical protein
MAAVNDLPEHLVAQAKSRTIGVEFPERRIPQGFQAFLKQSREDGTGLGVHGRRPPFLAVSFASSSGKSHCMTAGSVGKEKTEVAVRQLPL